MSDVRPTLRCVLVVITNESYSCRSRPAQVGRLNQNLVVTATDYAAIGPALDSIFPDFVLPDARRER